MQVKRGSCTDAPTLQANCCFALPFSDFERLPQSVPCVLGLLTPEFSLTPKLQLVIIKVNQLMQSLCGPFLKYRWCKQKIGAGVPNNTRYFASRKVDQI